MSTQHQVHARLGCAPRLCVRHARSVWQARMLCGTVWRSTVHQGLQGASPPAKLWRRDWPATAPASIATCLPDPHRPPCPPSPAPAAPPTPAQASPPQQQVGALAWLQCSWPAPARAFVPRARATHESHHTTATIENNVSHKHTQPSSAEHDPPHQCLTPARACTSLVTKHCRVPHTRRPALARRVQPAPPVSGPLSLKRVQPLK